MKKKSLSTVKKGGGSQDASQLPSGKESDKQKAKCATGQEKIKPAGRARFNTYPRDQGDGQAGPSHEDWPALPTMMGAVSAG